MSFFQCSCACVRRDVLYMWLELQSHTPFMSMRALPFVLVYNSWEESSCILYGFIFQPWEVKAYLSEWVWRLNLLLGGFRPGWGLQWWWDAGKTHPPSGDVCCCKKEEGDPYVAVDVRRGKTEPLKTDAYKSCKNDAHEIVFKHRWLTIHPQEVNNVARYRAKLHLLAKTDFLQILTVLSYCC